MIHDQANELRQLVRSRGRHDATDETAPRLFAVTGAQRGAGATTVAVNLAVAFAKQGQRAILIDADLDRAAVMNLCGVVGRASILDILSAKLTIHEVLVRGPAGVLVVPGIWAPADASDCSAMAQSRLISQIKRLGAHADVVVIDTGCNRGGFVRRFWQAADLALMVTTSDPMAIMDCYATIKVLLAGTTSIGVKTFVNRTPTAERADEVQNRIAAACRRFLGVRSMASGHLPDDPLIDAAARAAVPFVVGSPQHGATQALERLADELLRESASSPTKQASSVA